MRRKLELVHDVTLANTGRRLAVELLLEIRELGAEWTQGQAQSDVLSRYLEEVRKADAETERAFLGVLTDFIGSSLDGATPDPEFYEVREGR